MNIWQLALLKEENISRALYTCTAYGEVAFVTLQATYECHCIYPLCVFSIWGWQTISFQLSVYPSRDSFHMLFKVVCLHVSGLMFKHACCLCWQCTVKAASVLHDKLFRRLLLSPMHFFDTTPLGRILTRFSRDMDEGKAWFVLTGNLSPKRVLSVKSPWLTRCTAEFFAWGCGFLLSISLVSSLDILICGLLFLDDWICFCCFYICRVHCATSSFF